MRKFKDYLVLYFKGTGMGASDVVPGVSGGTIAFITGIYEELIHSIKSIDAGVLRLLLRFRWKEMWSRINGNFLLAVFAGVLTAVFTLANLLEYLLETHPDYIWSFFFGLVLASAIMILKDIRTWSVSVIISLIAGLAIAFWITMISPAQTTEAPWLVFLSGALAICAMILPGISGSFILLLLGKYQYILNAVSELKFSILLIFMAGAVLGLISFSKFLSWLLKKFRFQTIALLAGFMGGSLNKIWPWKETTSTFTDRHGEIHPLTQKNILPESFTEPSVIYSLLFAIAGFILIFFLMRLSKPLKSNEE